MYLPLPKEENSGVKIKSCDVVFGGHSSLQLVNYGGRV